MVTAPGVLARGDYNEVLAAYGDFIAGLAPWTHFVTLTHDPRRLEGWARAADDANERRQELAHTRVGVQGHRKAVRRWLFNDVRRIDPSARWWSETEVHKSGAPHEHGLLAVSGNAPVFTMAGAWFNARGGWRVEPIEDVVNVARYVAKYTEKAGAGFEPTLAGFGLHGRSSFSIGHPTLMETRP